MIFHSRLVNGQSAVEETSGQVDEIRITFKYEALKHIFPLIQNSQDSLFKLFLQNKTLHVP